ncbi:unnamed protein product [marine sediment metagenome]|uniref:peptidylprolyl isomerase n=1 Tax=marine sediment metagenome TaxID=412755 RepID=X1ANW5_9ZZZZ
MATAFLKENKKHDGIITFSEQLQYKVVKEGTGPAVVKEATPLIHYKGKLIDGTIFADSYESKEPISLPLAQTIAGFNSGLVGMKEGEQRMLYIHPDMAYGVDGHLPPNSLLIFDVTIVKADTTDKK